MNVSILYRGPLSSCNYGCGYCPFALRRESSAELGADRAALERFLGWVRGRRLDRLSIFFTPYGEALVRPWYREAVIELSRLSPVAKVAVQTNLSCDPGWVERSDRSKLALWCSYHPGEVSRGAFLGRCRELDRLGIRYSVGAVGRKESEAELRELRAELPGHVYLWINALKPKPEYYSAGDVRRFAEIDPLFSLNVATYPSAGKTCRAGETVVTVDGAGTLRRCHFIDEPIGNLYEGGIEEALAPRPCTRSHCACHIGYVHLEELGLYETFKDGILERIPAGWPLPRAR
jgi:MoaA/NifB/PqqE/SkfB family radical SAM enzyme